MERLNIAGQSERLEKLMRWLREWEKKWGLQGHLGLAQTADTIFGG